MFRTAKGDPVRPVRPPSANALRSSFPAHTVDISKHITPKDRALLKWKFLTEPLEVLLKMLDFGQCLADMSEILGEIEEQDAAAVVRIRQTARTIGVPETHSPPTETTP
ncbi:hypothetical protein CCAX7_14650 [Capsulimonas corticalis]|uniref:Uncharacterized protein n=1 Tax=Capsulimonas corticalis TaxID=2219043 RepID=A0A402CZF2_9BACT|nr:hypothetical protein [Capsulimonas corticalis]BDI29414.1 hypothetical protein CCAX7_14650 [Capsulimonas corticalis]